MNFWGCHAEIGPFMTLYRIIITSGTIHKSAEPKPHIAPEWSFFVHFINTFTHTQAFCSSALSSLSFYFIYFVKSDFHFILTLTGWLKARRIQKKSFFILFYFFETFCELSVFFRRNWSPIKWKKSLRKKIYRERKIVSFVSVWTAQKKSQFS